MRASSPCYMAFRQHTFRQPSNERKDAAVTLLSLRQAHVYHQPKKNDKVAVLYNTNMGDKFYNGRITRVNLEKKFPYRIMWDQDGKREFAELTLKKEDFPEMWYFIE